MILLFYTVICTTVLLEKEVIGAIYEICQMLSNQNGASGISISHA